MGQYEKEQGKVRWVEEYVDEDYNKVECDVSCFLRSTSHGFWRNTNWFSRLDSGHRSQSHPLMVRQPTASDSSLRIAQHLQEHSS